MSWIRENPGLAFLLGTFAIAGAISIFGAEDDSTTIIRENIIGSEAKEAYIEIDGTRYYSEIDGISVESIYQK